jgi:hypothetical protein
MAFFDFLDTKCNMMRHSHDPPSSELKWSQESMSKDNGSQPKSNFPVAEQHGRLIVTHDRLRGHISYGGVVVDGIFLTFEQLAELMQTYEGFQFDLKIVDSSDDLT